MMFIFLLQLYFCIFVSTFAAVPDITGILVPINIAEATSTETLLDVFTVSDTDGDVIAACTLTGHNGEFDLRQLNAATDNLELYLLSSAPLDYDNYPSYSLAVTCNDSAGEIASETFTVDVTPNQAPTLIPPSAIVNVNENEISQRRLYVVNVTDPEGDAVSCSISIVSPNTTNFGIWQDSDGVYEVYLLNTPNLDYDVASTYIITIQCSDAYGSSSVPLIVDVEENTPPAIQNLPAGSNPSMNASSTPAGTSVYTVTANDSDSTTLTFSLTSSPVTPDVFQINADTGEITTSRDLIYAVGTSYDLTVTVSDGDSSASEVLRVELTDVNTAPVITNLPDTVSKSEEIAGGSSIFTLSVSDPDDNETYSFTWSVAPSVYTSKFSLDNTTYVLSLGNSESLDYESQSSLEFNFTVSDQKAETGPHILYLTLIDENEPCSFDKTTYYVTTYEANKGGGTQDPGFVVNDPDSGDSYKLSLVTSDYSNLFSLDSSTGEISFDVNYDIDNGVHPSNVTFTVQCSDAAGETGTATLSVTVLDVNDNTPEFGNTGYIIYCDQYDAPGSTIDTLNAQDDDSGNNGDIEYTWTPVFSTFYSLNSNGAIILKVDPIVFLTYGDTHRFIATATDQGSPRLSSTVTIDVVYREATTTTTTTEAPSDLGFFDQAGNIVWVVCVVLLGILGLALLAYMLYKYIHCGKKGCKLNFKNKSKPRKTKVKPDPRPTPFEFWNDGITTRTANRVV